MKTYVRWPLLIITLAILSSLLFLFHLSLSTSDKSTPKSQVVGKASSGLPVRLKIPSINVDAAIEYVGFTSKRAMEVPKNTTDVGWFKLGPVPGDRGSAVMDGHVDGENNGAGVFANLYQLKKGDKLYVEDNKGKSITFVVRESRIYDPGLAEKEVFSSSDSAHLNLITCDGIWDGVKKSYSKRLVVFTDIGF